MNRSLLPVLLALARHSDAISVDIPLSEQLPAIARVNQPYTWNFSPATFSSPISSNLTYSIKTSPDWMHFDSTTRTFSGTPTVEDIGHPEIIVSATDGSSSNNSRFSVAVSSRPSPRLNKPVKSQFYPENPSLSSVFVLSANSAMSARNPALRIPPKWSFSVGFEWDTFISENDLHYSALQADGSPLPEWMNFNTKGITLNGYTPGIFTDLSLALHISDEEGYSAASLPFDIIIAPHELSSLAATLPNINITAGTAFNFSMRSPADLAGILLDGKPISSEEVEDLSIDTSRLDWLHYDEPRRVLSGETPTDLTSSPSLPITLTAFNQTIHTNVSLDLVPSYFTTPTLPFISISSFGEHVNFSLIQYFSNATKQGKKEDVTLTAAFDPYSAQDSLIFDPERALITGFAPKNLSSTHISVTFTAYSRFTHSTSHTSLAIAIPRTEAQEDRSPVSRMANPKLLIALKVVFGVVGGICAFIAFLVVSKRCLRVEDTALTGEEGTQAWSEKDKKWYGLSSSSIRGRGHFAFRGCTPNHIGASRQGMELDRDELQLHSRCGQVGLGLEEVTRTSGSTGLKASSSPGFMSKKDFVARIKDTVRKVSGSVRGSRKMSPRPVIGKPILRNTESRSFNQAFPGSTFTDGSPSSSSGGRSIPRQRPEFAPSASPAQVHSEPSPLSRQLSLSSTMSLATHAEEAVVQIATRASSIRSAKTGSFTSQASELVRPRLVPFTSARVPVPLSPSSTGAEQGMSKKRHTSHHADLHTPVEPSKADDLSIGLHYVQALGADASVTPSGASFATNRRSSFSSLESSNHGHRLSIGKPPELALLARIDEKFSSRVPVHADATTASALEVKQISGGPIPAFLKVNLNNISGRYGAVLFSGTPRSEHKGKSEIGIFLKEDGTCVARVVLEVVGRS